MRMHWIPSAVMSAVALALAGCGGGSSPTADTRAPLVTIAASSGTVEAGQTAQLTASATDDVDGTVAYTLSCSAGTLSGTTLTAPVVDTAQAITCTASARDAAGNPGQASVSIQVLPRTAALEVDPNRATLQAGQLGLLNASGLPLERSTYAATLGGRPVTLYRTDDGASLVYEIPPDLAAGPQTLQVAVGTRAFSLTVPVTAAPEIADPRGFLRDALTRLGADAEQLLAAQTGTIGAAGVERLTGARQTLADGLARLDTFGDAELRQLATVFAANGFGVAAAAQPATADGRVRALVLSSSCSSAKGFFLGTVVGTVAMVAAGKPLLLSSTPLTALVGAASLVTGAIGIGAVIPKAVENVLEVCVNAPSIRLLAWILAQGNGHETRYRALSAVPASLSFVNKAGQDFRLESKTTLVDEVVGSVRSAAEKLLAELAVINWAPESVTRLVDIATRGLIKNLPASGVVLSGTSDARVSGTVSGAGERLTLTFTAASDVNVETIPFTFSLTPAGQAAIPVSATLNLTLPQVQAGAVTARQNRPVSSQLQVSNAERLEVLVRPTKGTVALANDGSFTYTPASGAFGDDSFSYRGVNGDGVSEPATVSILIERRFEGTWNIVSTSRTTSESTPGLCPDTENAFSVFVAKASDTRYTTSYSGVDIVLTMGSVDDPAGLRFSDTVTYPDGAGTTTESLSISVPDSDTLSGSGSFSYRAAGGVFCNGVTSVSGSR